MKKERGERLGKREIDAVGDGDGVGRWNLTRRERKWGEKRESTPLFLILYYFSILYLCSEVFIRTDVVCWRMEKGKQ